jgi:hypothetical protein
MGALCLSRAPATTACTSMCASLSQVHFVNEEDVISALRDAVKGVLASAGASRTYYTQVGHAFHRRADTCGARMAFMFACFHVPCLQSLLPDILTPGSAVVPLQYARKHRSLCIAVALRVRLYPCDGSSCACIRVMRLRNAQARQVVLTSAGADGVTSAAAAAGRATGGGGDDFDDGDDGDASLSAAAVADVHKHKQAGDKKRRREWGDDAPRDPRPPVRAHLCVCVHTCVRNCCRL